METGNFGRTLRRLREVFPDHKPREGADATGHEAFVRRGRRHVQAAQALSESRIRNADGGQDALARLSEHWGLRGPCMVMHAGEGAESDELADMLASLQTRLAHATLQEIRRQANLIASRILLQTQGAALRAVSEKLGVRFREPGKPRLILELFDRQERFGEVFMDLSHADWQRVQAAIQRNFGRPADLGYFAAEVPAEQLKELQKQAKRRRGHNLQTFPAPLCISPARSKPSRLQRIHSTESFRVFLALAKSANIFALDDVGGQLSVPTLVPIVLAPRTRFLAALQLLCCVYERVPQCSESCLC